MIKLSPSEQVYLQRGIAANMRNDGRECTQLRRVSMETGIVSQANGSARVNLGDTDVVVGIKVEVRAIDRGRAPRYRRAAQSSTESVWSSRARVCAELLRSAPRARTRRTAG